MVEDLKKIAGAYAEENCSDAIYPAHLFKAALHKDVGLISFIEVSLDRDYYYLMDWADVQVRLSPRAARPVRHPDFSSESDERCIEGSGPVDRSEDLRWRYGIRGRSAGHRTL